MSTKKYVLCPVFMFSPICVKKKVYVNKYLFLKIYPFKPKILTKNKRQLKFRHLIGLFLIKTDSMTPNDDSNIKPKIRSVSVTSN